MKKRRPADWTRNRGVTFRKSEGVPFTRSLGHLISADAGTAMHGSHVVTREKQIESASREIAALDGSIPERVRRAYRTHCNFDMSFQVLMRFARSAERKRLSDAEIADAFKRIKTEQDAAKFRAVWSQSV